MAFFEAAKLNAVNHEPSERNILFYFCKYCFQLMFFLIQLSESHTERNRRADMKRVMLLVLVLCLFAFPAYGTDRITVLVNGKQIESDTPAVNSNGSVMLPFRSVLNALGVSDESIKWNPGSKSIEIRDGNRYIFLVAGNTGAILNDSMIMLNAAPYIDNGRTLVPVRFVSEALGADVRWDPDTKTVTVTK